MKRAMPMALFFAGMTIAAIAQDTPDTAPVPEENALPPAASAPLGEPELGADVAPPAEPLVDDPTLPGDNPIDPLDPAAPAVEPTAPAAPPAADLSSPADPAVEPGIPAAPAAAADAPALPTAPGQPALDNETPSALPPNRPRARLPQPAPGAQSVPPSDPLVDPLRESIENEPLSPNVIPGQPIPPNGTPPAARPVTPNFDPAYDAPAPPRVQPQIEIKQVVHDPIRIHDARLLVLMGHIPAATKAIDTLGHRFPTDPRVQYLKFYLLSRSGKKDKALGALQKAVALERLYPLTDYDRFMEPLQGADRFYVERVRRAAAELASVDGLVEPDANDYLPKESKPE